MVLDKLSVPGRPTDLDNSRTMAYCACTMCGWGLFGHFFSRLSSAVWETARYVIHIEWCHEAQINPTKAGST